MAGYFLQVAAPPLVDALGPAPTQLDVSVALSRLSELLQSITQAPQASAQGLWAELFLIDSSPSPIGLASAWHAEPRERFDFAQGTQRVEVKSTSTEPRRHVFSLEQVRPPADLEVVVASLIMPRSTGGLSLGDLLARVRSKLAADLDLVQRLDQVVAQILGHSLQAALQHRFDEAAAATSVRYYAADDVPAVGLPLPAEVTAVRFIADLSGVVPQGTPSATRNLFSLLPTSLPPVSS